MEDKGLNYPHFPRWDRVFLVSDTRSRSAHRESALSVRRLGKLDLEILCLLVAGACAIENLYGVQSATQLLVKQVEKVTPGRWILADRAR